MGRIRALLRSLLPRQALIRLHCWRAHAYIRRLRPEIVAGRKTILILNHFYGQDIKALQLANPGVNLVPVESGEVFQAARMFFSPAVMGLLAAYTDEDPRRRAEYREVCADLLRALQRRCGSIDLIVTASDIFYWIREFIGVARESGIRTVVLDKEGTISPHDFEFESARIRRFAPPMSDHICVWSAGQKEFWLKVGAREESITITGQPRSDLFFRDAAGDEAELVGLFERQAPLITFFTYFDTAYIPIPLVREQGLTWARMKQETHEILLRCARTFPAFNFVIKTHPQQPDLQDIRRRYAHRNLAVVGGSTLANALLRRSELIIGFQTTVLIEAMLLEKPVIYTAWDLTIPRVVDHLLPFHASGGAVIAESAEAFASLCENFCRGDRAAFVLSAAQQRERAAFVGRYIHQPDGHASERVFHVLQRFL